MLVGKRFDLCAYLATHQLDVLAIVETFLDDSIHDLSIARFGYVIHCHDHNRNGGSVLLFKCKEVQ